MRRLAAAVLMLLAAPVEGRDDEETIAFTQLRIIPVGREEIASGTLVLKGGKIAEVGKDVKPPAGAKVIESKGRTAFPGLVHAFSRIGLAGSSSGSGAPTPQHLAVDELNPTLDAWGRVARAGVTSLGVYPLGGSISGQGAVIKPLAGTKAGMLVDGAAFLKITMQASSTMKDGLRQGLEGAKKAIEAEKKPAPTPAPAPVPAAPAKPDDKVRPLVRFLKGEIPALVTVSSAAEILHFGQVMEGFKEFKTRVVVVASAEAYKAAELLGETKARVLLRPEVAFLPQTRNRVNPAAEIARAGATVGLLPDADFGAALEGYFFRVGELVKHGFSRSDALRAMTLTPAQFLGVEKRVGSIEAGKDADLLLLDGDPLAAGTRIVDVYINGRRVAGEEAR